MPPDGGVARFSAGGPRAITPAQKVPSPRVMALAIQASAEDETIRIPAPQ